MTLTKAATKPPARKELLSVKEILGRKDPVTVKPLFWSSLPGKIVNKHTGEEARSLSIDPKLAMSAVEWYMTLQATITDMSCLIHRSNRRGPATFIVVNRDVRTILECMVSYRLFQGNNPSKGRYDAPCKRRFVDAKLEGNLNNKFDVYLSEEMPGNKILVGRFGDGIEVEIIPPPTPIMPGAIANVEIVMTKNPLLYKGEVSYRGFIKVMNMGIL